MKELFKVAKVICGDPNVFEVEPMIGKFYEEELFGIDKKDDIYKVEKIVKWKLGERKWF